MNKKQHMLMGILQKISVFQGLDLGEAERLVHMCATKAYEAGSEIYRVGAQSDEMLVLVKGSLTAVSKSGQELGTIRAGSSTGEMGVFTGHVRSASIVAVEDCLVLAIAEQNLRTLLDGDSTLKAKVLANVVDLLAARLKEANQHVAELKSKVPSPEEAPAISDESDEPAEVDEVMAEAMEAGSGDGEEEPEEEPEGELEGESEEET